MSINYKLTKMITFIGISVFLLITSCSEISAPTDNLAPAIPANFRLIGGGDGQAYIGWESNYEIDFKEFQIYRSVNNVDSFDLLVSLTQTEYIDKFLDYDSTYFYYAKAIDNAGNSSDATNIVNVQPLNISAPQSPTRIIASGSNNPFLSSPDIRLLWIPPDASDLKYYLIYKSDLAEFTATDSTFSDSVDVSMFIDKNIVIGQNYFYQVVAVDKGGKLSLPSRITGDKVLATPQLQVPANSTAFNNPRVFQWSEVDGAVEYQIFVGTGYFTNVIWNSAKISENEVAYTGPSLQQSKIYYWWVGAYSKEKIIYTDGTEEPSQINSYSLVNSFYVE